MKHNLRIHVWRNTNKTTRRYAAAFVVVVVLGASEVLPELAVKSSCMFVRAWSMERRSSGSGLVPTDRSPFGLLVQLTVPMCADLSTLIDGHSGSCNQHIQTRGPE